MSEDAQKSRIRRLGDYISPVWFVPLIALLIGIWMVAHSFSERGPMVTMTVQNADGIQGGTKIRARSVDVGEVQSVDLSDDASHAVIKARMDRDAERLLGDQTKFWVVKPRIGRDGISGLNTVLSGAYIEMQPDVGGDGSVTEFNMLDQPPVAPSDAGGLRIHLDSKNGNALSIGDPVVFQGYTVGRVEASRFDPDERMVHYDLYIFKRYASMVTANTHFWVTSGIDFDISASGFNMQLGSLETLLSGGVTFDVNHGVDPGSTVDDGTHFQLFPTQELAEQGSYNQYIQFVVLLDDSIRGLSVGAPVEYRGVRIGTVVEMPWRINRLAVNHINGFRIPVLIRIEPQRLQPVVTGEDVEKWKKMLAQWTGHGMRASLATANIVTGALYIDLSFVDKESAAKTKATQSEFEGVQVFPSTQSGYSQITGQVSNLLEKVNALDMQGTVNGVNQTLNNSTELLKQLNSTTQGVNELLNDPATKAMPKDVRSTLESANRTLEGFNPQSQAYGELQGTIQQLQQLLRNLQPAVRAISEKPNSLIFNRSGNSDPEPKAQP
ncbi:intermembrane transport protein PqiB [Carnimonas nigrificans]|uniref:intermembrane transport protein PqiB n=1 Tax=Carnimonas nigrificans TaxID=64323 RepID=UPI0004716A56|nr:intermembrane transport protein PqiB [Carnimonas nigrificans]